MHGENELTDTLKKPIIFDSDGVIADSSCPAPRERHGGAGGALVADEY